MLNPDRRAGTPQVYVWDRSVRLFHCSLVAGFTIAHFTEGDLLNLHVWAGYLVGLLIVARVLWGFVGPSHARFSDFIYDPTTTVRYVRDLVRFRGQRYLGHSPGGCAMVVILLIFVAATVVTGLVVYGGDQQAGPLAGMFSKETGEAMEGVHELIANITLALVLMHVSAVVLASFVHHENLARAIGHRQEAPVASPTLRGLRDTFAPLNCPRRAQLPRL